MGSKIEAVPFQDCPHHNKDVNFLNIGGPLVPQYMECLACLCVLRRDEPYPEIHLERRILEKDIRRVLKKNPKLLLGKARVTARRKEAKRKKAAKKVKRAR